MVERQSAEACRATAIIGHPALSRRPVRMAERDAPRTAPGRLAAATRGHRQEAWTLVRDLGRRLRRVPAGGQEGRFVVFGRGRSGTTLLTSLLNSHPRVFCDGEILAAAVLAPEALVARRAALSTRPVYGCKLLSYQLLWENRLADPLAFLARLQARGFRLIWIRRRTFDQVRSNFAAKHSGLYHARGGAQEGERGAAAQRRVDFRVEPERFLAHMRQERELLDLEARLMANFPHLAIDYDADLARAEDHQPTMDAVFGFLGVEPQPVRTRLRKISAAGLGGRIENLEELREAVARSGLDDAPIGAAREAATGT